MLIDRAVTWSNSATTLDIESNNLAVALQKPKKVGVKMVGLSTTKSMTAMLNIAANPNLESIMHSKMILGEP